LRHRATNRKVAGSIHDGVIYYGCLIDKGCNRIEYQEYFLGDESGQYVGMTTLPPSCADCLEIWEIQTPGALRACPYLFRVCFTFTSVPYSSVITPVFHILVITPESHGGVMISPPFLFVLSSLRSPILCHHHHHTNSPC